MKSTGYKRLDLNKLNNRIFRTVSMEEALKDITPLELPESVLHGEKQVVVKNASVEDGACVKLEISYS